MVVCDDFRKEVHTQAQRKAETLSGAVGYEPKKLFRRGSSDVRRRSAWRYELLLVTLSFRDRQTSKTFFRNTFELTPLIPMPSLNV